MTSRDVVMDVVDPAVEESERNLPRLLDER